MEVESLNNTLDLAAMPEQGELTHEWRRTACSYTGENVPVTIGQNSNLQDRVSVGTLQPTGSSTVIGSSVSVGHGAVLQGCVVEDGALIGMSAVLEEGSRVSFS